MCHSHSYFKRHTFIIRCAQFPSGLLYSAIKKKLLSKKFIKKMLLPFSALFVLLLFTVCCSLLLFVRDNNDSNLESLIMVFRGFVLCAP